MGDNDPIARLRAEMDQAREGVKEFAVNLHAFYDALVDEGFTGDEAIAFCHDFLIESLRGIGRGSVE